MSPSMGAPFSMPKGNDMMPLSKFARTSAGDTAMANLSGDSATMPSTILIKRSARSLAPFISDSAGVKMDMNGAFKPPATARG